MTLHQVHALPPFWDTTIFETLGASWFELVLINSTHVIFILDIFQAVTYRYSVEACLTNLDRIAHHEVVFAVCHSRDQVHAATWPQHNLMIIKQHSFVRFQ
jgi:hypothetical protein